uniref:STI1/HOP DP domain-containing protein n=1 Tax=Phytophthora ramorum TaxID=164328 RepID=H3GGI3_PHYRM
MKDMGHENWEDDEPPMLGEVDTSTEDNQLAEETSAPDTNIMDEMVAIAQYAKENKRKQQAEERNRKSFGQGLKKGFFNTTKTTKDKKAASVKSPPTLEPARQQPFSTDLQREERLLVVKQQEEEASKANPTFVFPEVQEAMNSMNQLDPKALQNPAFSKAIADMQQDPQAAVLKYQKDPAVSVMMRDFMEFLGSHFEELGSSAEATSSEKKPMQEHYQGGQLLQDFRMDRDTTPPAPKPPAIVDLDETRRHAIAEMQRRPEEEEQVQHILKNPELLAALSDGNLMQRLHACQQSPGQLQRLAQDPVLGPKLRLLVQHNMVQFAS